MRHTSSFRGFTIVELLIVIVVIGILAAVTIVAFNGVQQRAKNASKISSVQQYIKLIQAYHATYGTYPSIATSCATVDNVCTNNSGVAQTTSNTTLITELSKIGTVPQSMQPAAGNAYGMQYIYSSTSTYNGELYPVRLEYYLQGNAIRCGVSNVTNNAMTGTTPATGYTLTTSDKTTCWVMVR